MKLKRHKKYEIKWIDTFGFNSWYQEEDIDKKTENSIKNPESHLGYLVKETKDYIILAMGMSNDKEFAPYNAPKWIPKGFIRSIKRLRS